MIGLYLFLSSSYLNLYCNMSIKEVNSIYLMVLMVLLVGMKCKLIGYYYWWCLIKLVGFEKIFRIIF